MDARLILPRETSVNFVFSDNDEVPFCQIVDSGSQVIVREENGGFSAISVISKGSTHDRTYCVRL